MGDRSWRPWDGEPYEPDDDEPLAALYAWTDGGVVFMCIGPLGSVRSLGDRLQESCVARPQVVPAETFTSDQLNDLRRCVVSEALAIAEGRAPRPYTEFWSPVPVVGNP